MMHSVKMEVGQKVLYSVKMEVGRKQEVNQVQVWTPAEQLGTTLKTLTPKTNPLLSYNHES